MWTNNRLFRLGVLLELPCNSQIFFNSGRLCGNIRIFFYGRARIWGIFVSHTQIWPGDYHLLTWVSVEILNNAHTEQRISPLASHWLNKDRCTCCLFIRDNAGVLFLFQRMTSFLIIIASSITFLSSKVAYYCRVGTKSPDESFPH